MKQLLWSRRMMGLLAVVMPLLGLFVYVALRTGPLAPVPVTVQQAEVRSLTSAVSGLGTVQARYRYAIGPTAAGRVASLSAQVGDSVRAGQILVDMDPVDLDDRIRVQQAALSAAQARLGKAEAQTRYAQTQSERYRKLLSLNGVSQEEALSKQQESIYAVADQQAAVQALHQAKAEQAALQSQRAQLQIKAPVDGLVVARQAEPGSTLMAGQTALELIDPGQLWVDARFDQSQAGGLAPGLPVTIRLRSRPSQALVGRVDRIEPLADAITEETLAKIVLDQPLSVLPPLGELAEVEVQLVEYPAALVIPNAAIQAQNGALGVWQYQDGKLVFRALDLGASDLAGGVLVQDGLGPDDQFVVYSQSTLTVTSKVLVQTQLQKGSG
ncbi:efflux RND transporter periplasmic adaptor subunit [Castellaniella sp.]|uniref:efflux RND transporter periplasmic adaptor subunit n=1 Tax=Castellaniella sp. TaxID=1955812 RepID=UPI002AFED554|nr:efflux RND transporter periplasmic adaptor subunit [Castellaniella sp.]